VGNGAGDGSLDRGRGGAAVAGAGVVGTAAGEVVVGAAAERSCCCISSMMQTLLSGLLAIGRIEESIPAIGRVELDNISLTVKL
jgi:tRNA(Met) C34 N-acetyltransferase TmcA